MKLHFEQSSEFGDQIGFTGSAYSFRGEAESADWKRAAEHFGCSRFFFLRQVHGSGLIDLSGGGEVVLKKPLDSPDVEVLEPLEPGDAALVYREQIQEPVVLTVRTADCVPLLLLNSEVACVVHAGWRGLALGIIEKAARLVGKSVTVSDPTYCWIGPCADAELYEVASSLLEHFEGRPHAHAELEKEGKALLNLRKTAEMQLAAVGLEARHVPGNTISSEEFHSYRREPKLTGFNMGFLRVSPSTD